MPLNLMPTSPGMKWPWVSLLPKNKISVLLKRHSGLTGGILKMPQGCKPGDQPMGRGLTVYYSVSSLDKVGL